MKSALTLGLLMLATVPVASAQDTSAWSAVQNDGSLNVTAGAALAGTSFGLEATMNDLATIWVQDDSPAQETRYRQRFYFDTNNFDTGNASGINRTIMFIAVDQNPTPEPGLPTRRLYLQSIRYRPDEIGTFGTAYGVIFWVYQPTIGNYINFGPFRVSPGEHFVETDWQAASGPGLSDGRFEVWIDGASPAGSVLTGLVTNGYGADFCRLGIIQPLASSNTTIVYDEFESRRQTYIGPIS
jgi:hypothetical protein